MVLFDSMSTISVCTAVAVAALIYFGTGKQPFATAWMFLKSLVLSRKYLFFFAAVLAIIALNKNELKLEHWINVDYDLTPYLSGWEGDWPAWLQSKVQSDWLTAVCSVFYLVMFQAVMIASVGIYTQNKNLKLYYSFCVALLLNYFLAVPFYLFVPVNEVWYVHPQVQFLILDAFPRFEQEYRALSGLNNCFPSLHTSISLTLAIVASKSGIRRWAVFTWVNAAVILFSIYYLGIHWFTDMLAGIALAVGASAIGLKFGAWAVSDSPGKLAERVKTKFKPSRALGSSFNK
ncbi:phosphatase PAP2 family protein [Cohnella suwonensis]|uniref:Phosphatase PAP2 family protein n=1 Tax=Cohnella suwonensis TaxID=696072 RepID=A0ABW0LX19_9BACL